MRNQSYKLIRQTVTDIDPQNTALGANCAEVTTDEFYRIDEKSSKLVCVRTRARARVRV